LIRTLIKWSSIVVTMLVTSVIALLLAVGVPKSPTLTVENVGRVAWAPMLRTMANFDRLKSKKLVAWMPNGSGLLVGSAHRIFDSRIHLVPAPGADPVLLPNLPRNVHGMALTVERPYGILSWDTGGDELYRLYRWDLDRTRPVALTPEGEKSHFGAFEPDGTRIAYTSNRRNGTDFDVYLLDPTAPETDERAIDLEGSWSVEDWSNDQLLLSHQISNVANELYLLDLQTLDLEAMTEATEPALYRFAQWSADGESLFYASDRGTEFAQLRRLDLATGEESVLSAALDWDVTSIQESGDGALLLIGFNEDGYDRYYLTDRSGAEFDPLDPAGAGLSTMALHPRDRTVFVTHTDVRGLQRVYTYDLDRHDLALWSGVEPRDADVPQPRSIRYATFDQVDGEPRAIPATVYPGVGPGPRPVLISIHGGPEAQAKVSTRWRATQKRGVTVITPNVRGSTGYGRSYERLDNGMRREDAVRDIGALLDWVEGQPDLDPAHVAVTGGSYGGYMVLASLVHYSDRIACGIDRVGVSNFVTFLENTADWRRDLRRAEYGDERDPEMRDFLEEISPLNNADRITSRLMVVQGANDPRVPVTESRQLVDRVGANGRPVGYLEASDEGHGFRKPWNSYYANAAEQQMLTECLALR